MTVARSIAPHRRPETAERSADSPGGIVAAWRICEEVYRGATGKSACASAKRFGNELLFCLLGGYGISFELAVSASLVVGALDPFASDWDEALLFEELCALLGEPQFEPRTTSGALRRYRFPTRKARLIVDARRWALDQGSLVERLAMIESEHERRRLLCECPGIGKKTASWVLRNTGLASRLAILDVHVVRALREAGRIRDARLPHDYETVEAVFVEWCDELAAPPAAFDLFLWEVQRGAIRLPS